MAAENEEAPSWRPGAAGTNNFKTQCSRPRLARAWRRCWARLALTVLAPGAGAPWSARRSARLDELLLSLDELGGVR